MAARVSGGLTCDCGRPWRQQSYFWHCWAIGSSILHRRSRANLSLPAKTSTTTGGLIFWTPSFWPESSKRGQDLIHDLMSMAMVSSMNGTRQRSQLARSDFNRVAAHEDASGDFADWAGGDANRAATGC